MWVSAWVHCSVLESAALYGHRMPKIYTKIRTGGLLFHCNSGGLWIGGCGVRRWRSCLEIIMTFFLTCFKFELLNFFFKSRLDLFLALWLFVCLFVLRSVLLETAVPSYPVTKWSVRIQTLNKIHYARTDHLIPKVVENYLAGGASVPIPGKWLRGEGACPSPLRPRGGEKLPRGPVGECHTHPLELQAEHLQCRVVPLQGRPAGRGRALAARRAGVSLAQWAGTSACHFFQGLVEGDTMGCFLFIGK